jgi:hypothetical protein
MGTTSNLATFTITPFTRHSPECAKKDNPQWKRCNCRKHLYIYELGKVTYVSARTRSWEQAERVAQSGRDKHDPVKIELAKIDAERPRLKRIGLLRTANFQTLSTQWTARWKNSGTSTKSSYATVRKSILDWADTASIVNLSDVTADALDKLVGTWTGSKDTQGFLISRVRAFFKWAHALHKMDENPTLMLPSVKRENEEETQPLTVAQSGELIAAT